ncbi:hypothetical protein [Streptomyces sp. NPDC048650]|uniref:hypothetical protein n=1 Tax=Streptomyces sp. NPDC048650 TaxID=3365583 RepID=UPI00371A616A
MDAIGAAYERNGALTHVPDPATLLVRRTTTDGTSAVSVLGPRAQASHHDGKDLPAGHAGDPDRVRRRPAARRPLLTRAGALVERARGRATPSSLERTA